MTKSEKDNVLNFPSNLSQAEKEVEALLFAAAEPLDIETIQAKITKKNKLRSTTTFRMSNFPTNPAKGGIPAIEKRIIARQPAIIGSVLYNPDKSLIVVTLT